jgi:hypothetical protein
LKQAQARRNVAKKPVTSMSGCSGETWAGRGEAEMDG